MYAIIINIRKLSGDVYYINIRAKATVYKHGIHLQNFFLQRH